MKPGKQEQGEGGEVNLFVKYLPANMNDAGLRQLFESCGKVVSAKVMVDGLEGSSLGYGFVRFSTPEEARDAVKKMTGLRIDNKALLCKLSEPSNYPELGDNLYIKPLPVDFDEEKLIKLFGPFGNIVTAKIMRDRATGESKQLGFVKFADQSCATAALEKMNGRKLEPHLPSLIVKYAESDLRRVIRQARVNPNPKPPSPPHTDHHLSPSTPPNPMQPFYSYVIPPMLYEYSPMAFANYPPAYDNPQYPPILLPVFYHY